MCTLYWIGIHYKVWANECVLMLFYLGLLGTGDFLKWDLQESLVKTFSDYDLYLDSVWRYWVITKDDSLVFYEKLLTNTTHKMIMPFEKYVLIMFLRERCQNVLHSTNENSGFEFPGIFTKFINFGVICIVCLKFLKSKHP